MKSFMFIVTVLFSMVLLSCEQSKNSGFKTWGELPVTHTFSDKFEDGSDLSDDNVVTAVFEEELAKEGLEGGESIFVRGTFWTEKEQVYYTWLCRVPRQGENEYLLEDVVPMR